MTALKIGLRALQGSGLPPAHGRGADRIEAETDIGRGRRDPSALHQGSEQLPGVLGLRAEIEIERDAGVEMDAVERARDGLSGCRKTVAVAADRPGKDQGEAGRAILEIVQRLGIGRGRIGMIEALHDPPGGARRAADNGPRVGLAAVERLDGEPVIGLGDELLVERRALEHALHQLAPLLARGRRKLGGQRQLVGCGVGHGHKMACHGRKML